MSWDDTVRRIIISYYNIHDPQNEIIVYRQVSLHVCVNYSSFVIIRVPLALVIYL